MYKDIRANFARIVFPDTTVITMKNGAAPLYGFIDFTGYPNDMELQNSNKFMFVPSNNNADYQAEYGRTQKKNPKYSLVVDVEDIQRIQLVDGNRSTRLERTY